MTSITKAKRYQERKIQPAAIESTQNLKQVVAGNAGTSAKVTTKMDPLSDCIFRMVALPMQQTMNYLNTAQLSGADRPTASAEDISPLYQHLYVAMAQLSELQVRQLMVTIINMGNIFDVQAYLMASSDRSGGEQLHEFLRRIVSFTIDPFLLRQRQLLYVRTDGSSSDGQVEEIKVRLSLPREASFDALSYKSGLCAAEYLCQLANLPPEEVSAADFSYINRLIKEMPPILYAAIETVDTIKDNVFEYEDAQKQKESQNAITPKVAAMKFNKDLAQEGPNSSKATQFKTNLIDTYTVFLEQELAPKNRDFIHLLETFLAPVSDSALVNYIGSLMPLFAKGIIPGALTPTSILMSHDMVAMGQITSTIYLLAEGLIQQTGDANFTDNDAVQAALTQKSKQRVDGNTNLTDRQSRSLSKAFILTEANNRLPETFRPEKAHTISLNTMIQTSGNQLDLADIVKMQKTSEIMALDPMQKATLAQSLALLLACIRIRLASCQNTTFELVQEADFAHLLVIQRLAASVTGYSGHMLRDEAELTIAQCLEQHNASKYSGLSLNFMQMSLRQRAAVSAQVSNWLRSQCKHLELFANKPELVTQLLTAGYFKISDDNRIQKALKLRATMRSVVMDSGGDMKQPQRFDVEAQDEDHVESKTHLGQHVSKDAIIGALVQQNQAQLATANKARNIAPANLNVGLQGPGSAALQQQYKGQ